MSSSQTRSMIRVFGVSVAVTVTSSPSMLTSEILLPSIIVRGPATAVAAPRIGLSVAYTSSTVRSPWPFNRVRLLTAMVAAPYWRSYAPRVLNIATYARRGVNN
jgi:hypothetical protein